MSDSKNLKSKVFKKAWELLRWCKLPNFSEALKSAWKIFKNSLRNLINKSNFIIEVRITRIIPV